jgi:hypothetical protein
MRVYFFNDTPTLFFDVTMNAFFIETRLQSAISAESVLRYIKMRYRNRGVYDANFSAPVHAMIAANKIVDGTLTDLVEFFDAAYDTATPYGYRDAFAIQNTEFQSIVFGQIRVPQMIKELGHTRLKTAGRAVRHKQFDADGNFTGYREYDVIFETHMVSGAKLNLREDLYAIRCWCTTTANEHWLWIEDRYKDDPLEAIASTFRVHENLIPFIKELKRQGDILLVELTSDVDPKGDLVSLTADQYFELLTAQS